MTALKYTANFWPGKLVLVPLQSQCQAGIAVEQHAGAADRDTTSLPRELSSSFLDDRQSLNNISWFSRKY
jgi:hypothetical protein